MPDLNLDLDYFDHPKTKRLIGLLGRGAEVLPIRLWCYCGKYHKEDGRLAGYSTQEIESILGWWGKPGELVGAMIRVKLLDVVEEDYVCHDWIGHQGHLPALHERAKKGAEARWAKLRGEHPVDASSNAPSNAKAMLEQCPNLPTIPTNQLASPREAREGRPDSLETVKQLFIERKYDNAAAEAEKFWNYWEARGWIMGKVPMKDWRAAAATWSHNAKEWLAKERPKVKADPPATRRSTYHCPKCDTDHPVSQACPKIPEKVKALVAGLGSVMQA